MSTDPRIAMLIVAGGTGSRAGIDIPKQYHRLGGIPVLRRTMLQCLRVSALAHLQAVIHPEHMELYEAACGDLPVAPPVHGGNTRQASVHEGLKALKAVMPDYVLIHDAARPFVSVALIESLIAQASSDAMIPALPVKETLKKYRDRQVLETVLRDGLLSVQTPQLFPYAKIMSAHDILQGKDFTDDAALCEAVNIPVRWTEGEARNIKLTTKDDLHMAEQWLAAFYETRIGQGIDVHRMVTHRSSDKEKHCVRLGGIDIPSSKCLEGHSDADAVLHAVVDAILGAIGEGDIGVYFPPSEARWKGADSAVFVQEALRRMEEKGGRIINLDVTILCEIPKIGPYRDKMRDSLARMMKLEAGRINIKATTTESLGFLGRKEGLCAQAVISVGLPA